MRSVLIGIVMLVLIVSVVIGIRWTRVSEPESVEIPPEAAWPDEVTPPPGYHPMNMGQFSGSLDDALDSAASGDSLSEQQRTKLLDAASDSIDTYWNGNVDRYAAFMEARGFKIDPALLENEGRLFRTRTMAVRGAPVRSDGVEVVWQVKAGRRVTKPSEPAPGMDRASVAVTSPRGPDDVIDPVASATDVVAITVPAFLRDYEGTHFEGAFRIFFARRPSDDEWLPVRIEIIYPSSAKTAIVPPV